MRPQKAQKIDLNNDYPCPCRRRGCLQQITLTEAMGCDRCQKIFVLEDNSHALEELSSAYPYKRCWRWNGNRWYRGNISVWESLPLKMTIPMVMMFVMIALLYLGLNIVWVIMLAALLVVFSVLLFWLAYIR